MTSRPGSTRSLYGAIGRLSLRGLVAAVVLMLIVWPAMGIGLGRFLPIPITPLMIQRSVVDGEERWRQWLSHNDIPDDLRRAVLASEDSRFCGHRGFDWREIDNAWRDYRAGKRLRGASTISMQTARTAFLWSARDPVRKGLEVWYTVLLETAWSKDRILDVYLNTVEWGPGVYGAEAAAQYYFGTPLRQLDRAQTARLVAVLPNPRNWNARSDNTTVASRSRTILARMAAIPVRDGRACP